jgi:conjugal transfer pilus assembly protein TraV
MSPYLTPDEMTSLRRALDKRTGGCVKTGAKPITVTQGIALWNATACFEASEQLSPPGIRRTPRRSARRDQPVRDAAALHQVLKAGVGVAALASLAGCTTMFGGNVKGSFSCRAPDGICAPTSKIDDAALALISGETSMSPAGPFLSPPAGTPRASVTAAAPPARSGEKVLRIVFPSHIDGAGRFREATAIHAVVERGEWMSASNIVRAAVPLAVMQSAPSSAQASADPLPIMPTLGELASAAPELQFPSAVADIDAQIAATEAKAAVSDAVPPPPRKIGLFRRKQVGQSERAVPASASMVAQSAAPPTASAPTAPVGAISARPPAQGAAPDPIAVIRAKVSTRLSASMPRSGAGAVSQTPASSSQPVPAAAVQYSLPAGASSQPSLSPIGAGTKTNKGASPTSSAAPVAPVNGPTLFPVSDVHP